MLSALLHIDQTLAGWVASYGVWVYILLFLVIFCETGLVVLPFLPGDSLLFAVGALCGSGLLSVWWIIPLLCVAATLGNGVNYAVGRFFVNQASDTWLLRWVHPKHMERTRQFYKKYGGVTLVLARFTPIVRTVAPFVAGMSQMPLTPMVIYTLCGGVFWVVSLVLLGFFFGELPAVKGHLSLLILCIFTLSLLPLLIGGLRSVWHGRKKQNEEGSEVGK